MGIIMRNRIAIFFAIAFMDHIIWGYPKKFSDCSPGIMASAVASIASNALSCDITLMHQRIYSDRKVGLLGIKSGKALLGLALQLSPYRSICVLRGDCQIHPYEIVYCYPSFLNNVAPLSSPGLPTHCLSVANEYDPLERHDDYVKLMFVSRQSSIRREVALPKIFATEQEKSDQFEADLTTLSDSDLLAKYQLDDIFSNHVYRVADGGIFHVNYEAHRQPQDGDKDSSQWLRRVAQIREEDTSLIHLSSREVSELVFLAYQLDGSTGKDGYAAACERCPELLRPVEEIQTELGKRLREALANRIAAAQGEKAP